MLWNVFFFFKFHLPCESEQHSAQQLKPPVVPCKIETDISNGGTRSEWAAYLSVQVVESYSDAGSEPISGCWLLSCPFSLYAWVLFVHKIYGHNTKGGCHQGSHANNKIW